MTTSNHKPDGEEKQFLEYHRRLIDEIHQADAHFKLWKRLQDYRADYPKELNQAAFFFIFTTRAHLDATLMHIFKVIDKTKGSLNIWKLLDVVEENLNIFSTEAFSQRMVDNEWYETQVNSHIPITSKIVQGDREKLKKLERITSSLKTWRNKAIAHIDRQFLLDGVDVAKQYPVKIGELEETITVLFEILNRYSYAYNSSTWMRGWPGEDDIQTVVDSIRFRIQAGWPLILDDRQ